MAQRIVDLSMEIHEGMQTFAAPWHPYVEITVLGRHGIENRETRKLTMGTHTGTHVDAPRHFIQGGTTIEHISLNTLYGAATVVDFSSLSNCHEVSSSEVISAIGDLPVERVILRFDWCKHLGTNRYYTDHPFLSEECCSWLISRGCRLIAMDTPQPDNPLNGRGSANDAPIHKQLLGHGVVLVEYLVNVRALNAKQVTLVVAPLKIRDGDGGPARCFAIENAQ